MGKLPRRDAAVVVRRFCLRLGLLGALDFIKNTTYAIWESTPGLLFRRGRNIPNELGNGDALTHTPVHRDALGAPELHNVKRKKCTPTPAMP